jgi:outer membrane receptor for monomeric catechols
MSAFGAGAPVVTVSNTWYIGVYASDTWRAMDRVTLNLGLRWEPYLGNNYVNHTISNFSIDNFRNGVKSTQYVNAPAGLLFPGDPGFPPGDTGFYKSDRD